MDYDKLIHCLKCCARVDAQNEGCDDCDLEYCGEECQQLCGTAATALSTLQAENEKLRAELEQVTLENNALWTYIEIVDREYRRYMDRGYIDRLDELKKVWKHGQKED